MIEISGNIWDQLFFVDAVCVTTNGEWRTKDGAAIMGRGTAQQAAGRCQALPKALGALLRVAGNHVFVFETCDRVVVPLVTFPAKHRWRQSADLNLIERSARELVALTDRRGWRRVVLPRPGCGAGGLRWRDVAPRLAPILDDRFYAIAMPDEK